MISPTDLTMNYLIDDAKWTVAPMAFRYCHCDPALFYGKIFHLDDPFDTVYCPFCDKILMETTLSQKEIA